MALSKKESPKKRIFFAIIIFICLLAVIYLILDNFILDIDLKSDQWQKYFSDMPKVTNPKIPNIKPHQKFFQEEKFIQLESFSELPIEAGSVGRENPFEPVIYEGQEAPQTP